MNLTPYSNHNLVECKCCVNISVSSSLRTFCSNFSRQIISNFYAVEDLNWADSVDENDLTVSISLVFWET